MLELVTQGTLLWLNEVIEESEINDGTGEGDIAGGQGGSAEPFLKINDRTSYADQAAAIKGYNEAQARITSLSGFTKVLEKYGAKDASPEYLESIVVDYLKRLDAEKAAASKKPTASADEDKEFEGVDPKIVAQTKQGRQWLKNNAEKVGLVSQEKYSKLEAEVKEMRESFTKKDEQAENAAIEEGQQKVTEWLGEAKVALTPENREELEDSIVAYINSKPALKKAWIEGDKASRVTLIRKGYELFLPIVKPGASAVAKASTTAGAGKTKAGLVNRTARRLPAAGDGQVKVGDGKKPLRIGDQSLRDRARALMDKMSAEGDGAGD